MPSPFDSIRDAVFNLTQRTFGYELSWMSQDGEASWNGMVHFRHPASEYNIGGIEYNPMMFYIEYVDGQLPGLVERVNSRDQREFEVVTVDGRQFNVVSIDEVRDGDTIRATLRPFQPQLPINRP
jgi:hypothetical protein